jgi:quinol-cytochrome oxidoreductase complex cytochrome b subunit
MGGYAPLFNTPVNRLLLGGLEVGQNTLLRFYVLHIMVFPLAARDLPACHSGASARTADLGAALR